MNVTSLRAIGQALEALHLSAFEVESHSSYYLVRVGLKKSLLQDVQDSGLWVLWRRLRGLHPAVLELRYTPNEVERLEREGQARRQNPDRMPDPFSHSQVLRAVSYYIERKRARLLRVSTLGSMGRVSCPARNRSTGERDYLRPILQPGNLKASLPQPVANVHPCLEASLRLT